MNEDAELLMNGLLISPRLLAGCFGSLRKYCRYRIFKGVQGKRGETLTRMVS